MVSNPKITHWIKAKFVLDGLEIQAGFIEEDVHECLENAAIKVNIYNGDESL